MDANTLEEDHATTRKRKRLSTACTRCRNRKVRCDDRQPTCTNCLQAGVECVTRDPRQPHIEVERREAQGRTWSPLEPKHARAKPQSTVVHAPDLRSWVIDESEQAGQTASDSATRFQREPNNGRLFSGPLPALPRFMSGNCLFTLTQWLDLAFARLGLPERFSWQYRANKLKTDYRTVEEVTSPQVMAPNWNTQNQASVDRFLATINRVFPLLDPRDEVLAGAADGAIPASTGDSRTFQIIRLLILAAGGAEDDSQSDTNLQILSFAFSKLTDLIQDESIFSIIALIMLAILFRGCDDSEMAWRVLANAVPKAQTLGLDRRPPAPSRSNPNPPQRRRQIYTWWSLFILDKILCIELQRPPMIRDSICDQIFPASSDEGPQTRIQPKCFEATIALAKIQGKVCERLLACTQAEESGDLTLEQAIKEKIQAGGELDQSLLEWADSLPADLRPSEFPSCDSATIPVAAFLAIQYYQTLFLIHRNALMIKPQAIEAELKAHFLDSSFRARISNSPAICSNIARSIVNVLNHILENDTTILLTSLYAPLVSVYTLAIQMLKNPKASSAKTDLEIQASAIRIIGMQGRFAGNQHSTILSTVETLHSQVRSRVQGQPDGPNNFPSAKHRWREPANYATNEITESPKDVTTVLAEGSEDLEIHVANQYMTSGLYSAASMADFDFFESNPDFSALDWDTIAQTLDLPSY